MRRLFRKLTSLTAAWALAFVPAVSQGGSCCCTACPGVESTGAARSACCTVEPSGAAHFACCGVESTTCGCAADDALVGCSALHCAAVEASHCGCGVVELPVTAPDDRAGVAASGPGLVAAALPIAPTVEPFATESRLRADNRLALSHPPLRILHCTWIE